MRSSEISAQIEKFIGKPHALGDTNKGWDCLNSVMAFYRAFGYEFPKELEGINEENYADVWRKNPVKARSVFARFLFSLGISIHPNFYRRGDLLLFHGQNVPTFPAISLGNGNILMVFDKGPQVVPFDAFKKYFVEARRLIL